MVALAGVLVLLTADAARAAIFTVNSTGDAADAAPGDGACATGGAVCTLRAAIEEVNALAGADTINFGIAPAGAKTITLLAVLPSITSVVSINGTTQPGFVASPPYAPVIEISAAAGGAAVIDLRGGSSGSTIRGLTINRCPFVGIRVAGSSNNVIAGNFLGTDLAGTAAGPGNQVGVYIGLSTVATINNRVGGTAASDRNLISGNTSDGVQINAGTGGTASNVVEGNYIGVDVTGSVALGNGSQGVALFTANANTNNRIGGTAMGAANVISGNGNDGVLIANAGTTGTRVEGNRIGTNAAGTAAIPNLRGVEISTSATGNTIGGAVAAAGNLISGNSIGVLINGANANSLQRNWIGTDAAGSVPLPNTQHGVQLFGGASNNLIGDASGNGNVISGNTLNGVDILQSGTNGNRIAGNTIGLDVTGTVDLGNLQFGVAIAQGASGNVVGEAGGGNVISGNDMAGVRIVDTGTNNNLVQLNYIGVDVSGTLPRPNAAQGVILDSGVGAATGNTIGGVGLGNVISGNGGAGIQVRQLITGTVITGNRIGTNAAGTAAVPNGSHGVQLAAGTTGHSIGAIGAPNLISGNAGQGVRIDGAGTGGNVVVGNLIGTDAAGTGALGNTAGGVAITNAATNNTIGGIAAGAGNRIAFNATYGINVATGAGTGNGILGNAIYGNVAELGIDLAHEPGVTSNDLLDGDAGANNLQNFPLLSAASTNTTDRVHIAGSLNSAAGTTYRIEFFATSALVGPDPSGFGEGERYLGATSVATDVNGNAVIGVSLAAVVSAGESVTATATDPSNNTSEFSAAILAYASVIVTTTADTVDGMVTSVSALITSPGGDNRISLREAIQATNATVGLDTVRFGIPLTDANHLYYRDNLAASLTNVQPTALADTASASSPAISDFDPDYPTGLTRSWYRIEPTSTTPLISSPLILDGSTQPGALANGPVIEIVGTSAGAAAPGFATGAPATPTTFRGLIVNRFAREGITSPAPTTTIQGCYIGTDPSGMLARGNATSGSGAGVYLGGDGSQLGGLTLAERNVISANLRNGVWVDANNVTIQGNRVGTDVTGSVSLGNGVDGVVLEPVVSATVTGVVVGGTAAGSPNAIAHNVANGIRVSGATVSGGSILGNAIHSNGSLGIDLGGDGPTLNDASDVDTGPNGLLNFPSMTPAVESTPGTLSLTYGLNLPAGFYRIELFKNPSGADPSLYGEGQVFAAAVVVNHPGGTVPYSQSLAGSAGDVISATATECTDGAACTTWGSTSEFSAAWAAVTTAVKLLSFSATGGDQSVRLEWQTASELANLGFHLYRSTSKAGPWTRITPSLVPGLGSSPIGASYSWADTALVNGTRYFYRLEDVDTRSVSTSHGPVSAVPTASSGEPDADADPGDGAPGTGGTETYGDPSGVSLRVLSRTARRALIELTTPGFYARRDVEGRVSVFIPGFDLPSTPRASALPFRRVLLDGEVGRGARLGAVAAEDRVAFPGLVPAVIGYPEIRVGADGTVRPGRRPALGKRARARQQEALARLVRTAFLGEKKKVVLELSPFDTLAGQLVLWRRLLVEVVFDGREPTETGSGRVGRRRPSDRPGAGATLALIHTSSEGLHAVPFEALRLGDRPLIFSRLALLRQGEAVPFHVEPARSSFGPGSVLYFYADREASSTAFVGEVVYELASQAGTPMLMGSAAPLGTPVPGPSRDLRRFEMNRIYQPGLLDAVDRWLWTSVLGGTGRDVRFALDGVEAGAPGRLTLHLQGGSDAAGVDHHVAFLVNGVPVGETRFDGKAPQLVELELPASALKEGENTLRLDNVGDTGVYSLVFLDRFEVTFPQASALRAGRFAGAWSEPGVATLAAAAPVVALDVTDPRAPVWLTAYGVGPDSLRLRVEAGRRYVVAASAGLLTPRVAPSVRSRLLDAANQADYVVVTTSELLPAAAPLVERRESQGLTTMVVTLDEIAASFGHGESSAEAIRSFLSYAFHSWARPSPRYVLLLGDASYDPRNLTGIAQQAPLPALWEKTTYLWTASDPTLAAVNGDDGLPDLALGRLPAQTLEQARALVAKVLDWEDSKQRLDGETVLVADNPDPAGDFEKDVDDIRASFLASRPTTTIKLRELGSLTRPAILAAFDRGASVISYVGHGGAAVWASENVLNSWDVGALAAQSRQPLMLTLNCLNGYFVAPSFDSVAEAFLKAEGRGTIAAFSPSGLSLDGPAHTLHRALMAEISSGRHSRLGDAVLAAQEAYAESGVMPELLSVYHLFGDPALPIR